MLFGDLGLVNRLDVSLLLVNNGLHVVLLVEDLGMLMHYVLLHDGLVVDDVGAGARGLLIGLRHYAASSVVSGCSKLKKKSAT